MGHLATTLGCYTANTQLETILTLLEDASVEDVKALGDGLRSLKEFFRHGEISLGHVAREVGSDTILIWEVDL